MRLKCDGEAAADDMIQDSDSKGTLRLGAQ
jgi:hypothetical protein